MNAQTSRIDLRTARSVTQIVRAAAGLYSGAPLMFVFLAAIILVPYEVVAVIVAQAKHVPAATKLILALAEVATVNPFITAMQMQVLLDLGEGRRPALVGVARRGIRVLAVVAAADIIAELIIAAGLSLLVVPGVLAAVRLAVVAPAAAVEKTAWPDALRRGYQLTLGNGWRVLGLLVVQAAVTSSVAVVLDSHVLAVAIIGAAAAIIAQPFCSLLISLLYFDLRARDAAGVASL